MGGLRRCPPLVRRNICFGERGEMSGYHAFRHGLATNLRALNVDDLTIMDILPTAMLR